MRLRRSEGGNAVSKRAINGILRLYMSDKIGEEGELVAYGDISGADFSKGNKVVVSLDFPAKKRRAFYRAVIERR